MRLSLAFMALPLAACSACVDGCAKPTACDGFPSITDSCGYFVLEGVTGSVCGCLVTPPEDEPWCSSPDARAPISMSWWTDDEPDTWMLGTWPDLGTLHPSTCPTPEVLANLGQGAAQAGAIPSGVDGNKRRDWVELTFSPTGDMAVIYERRSPGYERGMTMLRCDEGDEAGWILETFVDPVTSPFVRWGAQQGETRQVYLMIDDFYRLTLRVDTQLARPTGGGDDVPIVVLEQAELLAHSEVGSLAFGDMDVSFDTDEQGAVRDRFAIWMSGMDASYFPLYAEAAIYLMDLNDCAATCTDDMEFCCRTVFLDQGDSGWPDIPTNPGISDDGSLLAFNRFTSTKEQCPEWALCAQEHVLKNPLFHDDVFAAHCVEDAEQDGFHAPIDCSDLLTTEGRFDDEKCPDHQCCGDEGVDCSTCMTIGAQPEVDNACADDSEGVRERNYVFFFEMEGDTWLGFRSADLLGDLSEELHAYRLGFDAEGAFAAVDEGDRIKLLLGRGDGTPVGDFGPGPWRRLPGDAICD